MDKNKLTIEISSGSPANVVVSMNGTKIGLIQKINFSASADEPVHNLEITFPYSVDFSDELKEKITSNILQLNDLGFFVKINVQEL
ncbi:MAG: hypothetical protein LC122_12430 [Chitinophagales bacterium]|nr:hypothetical protein [Chitinophagales bacterium]